MEIANRWAKCISRSGKYKVDTEPNVSRSSNKAVIVKEMCGFLFLFSFVVLITKSLERLSSAKCFPQQYEG